ncbi:50S ribosomal protein L11 methyltransferase [Carboxylicivirga marina]|uniref:Ribosomal protein L11 methyltransferase n=1 Tax=Carboxylicivirga marina TaxID=2800988 RepID=A0ABS1HP10_9BACT|nr:50S ribosomal protein L11 methyltransferase [Carboxylicivirga marina]MBK3518983.1 50S ribosomal protein L11 methyltransferase [Carboxylicivirga marina]
MEYTKVEVKVSPVNEVANELLMAQMGEMGFESFEENDKGFNAYIPSPLFEDITLSEIYCPLEGISIDYSTEVIPDQNWNKEWEKNFFQPIIIEDKCIIRSSFHQVDSEAKYEIIIDPKMSFGTGHHETTSLILNYLLEIDVAGLDVLDMGCGTAILGMLCSMKGAAKVTGIDINEWAYNNAITNLELNSVSNMEVLLGGADLLKDQQYDLILANINRNILLADMANYAKVLKPGGSIYFSGFYSEDVEIMDREAQKYNLQLKSRKTDNNWTSLAYIKAE